MDIWGNGYFGANGHLGPMSIGASGHWGQMLGTWGKWTPGKVSTRANGYFGANGHIGTDGHWGK